MTDIQNILLDLLTDLDAICKKENIKYSLCLETAHSAVLQQSFYPSCCEANVAMTPDHALKFIAAVKKENRQDRIVDSMLSNPAYPDFTVRYGNPNTSMIHLPYTPSGAVPCMAVTIHMIRRKPATMNKVYRYSKAFWKACNVSPNAYPSSLKRTAIIGCHVIKRVLGASNLSRMLFKQWVSLFSANKKAKKLAIATDKYSFAADLLEAEDVCLLEGKQFPVFGYVDAYLNKAYGCSDFRKITPKYAVPSSTLLVSPYVPYQKYLDRAQELGVDFDAVRKNHAEYSKLRKQVSAYNKKIEKYYALVFRTEKRFAMYEHEEAAAETVRAGAVRGTE